jgi:hypothetical protein
MQLKAQWCPELTKRKVFPASRTPYRREAKHSLTRFVNLPTGMKELIYEYTMQIGGYFD